MNLEKIAAFILDRMFEDSETAMFNFRADKDCIIFTRQPMFELDEEDEDEVDEDHHEPYISTTSVGTGEVRWKGDNSMPDLEKFISDYVRKLHGKPGDSDEAGTISIHF